MQRVRHQFYAALIVAALSICAVIQLHDAARLIPSQWSDLYPEWRAAQAAIHHEDPYSTKVTNEIQLGFYGHVLAPEEIWEPQNFVYPAHLILFLAPLTFLPWELVRLAFAVAAPFAIGGTLWLWLDIAGLKLTASRKTLLYGLVLASWPAVWAYQRQQVTVFIFAAISLAVFCFSRNRDVAAGMLLALGTLKPNLVLLLAVWLAVIAISSRRWKFLGSFAATCAVFMAAAELIVPGWISEWIHVTAAYVHEPSKLSMLGHLFGVRWGFVAAGVLIIAAALRLLLYGVPLLAAAALLLSVSVCIMPTTPWMVYNSLLLIPSAVTVIASTSRYKLKRLLRFCAKTGLIWLACLAPITMLLFVLTHARLTLLPFREFRVVLCITICTIGLADRHSGMQTAAHP